MRVDGIVAWLSVVNESELIPYNPAQQPGSGDLPVWHIQAVLS